MGTSQYNMTDIDVSINFETASEKTIEQETLRVEITDAKGNPHTVHGSVKVNFIKKNGHLSLRPVPWEVLVCPGFAKAVEGMAKKANEIITEALLDYQDEKDHANGQMTIHDMLK